MDLDAYFLSGNWHDGSFPYNCTDQALWQQQQMQFWGVACPWPLDFTSAAAALPKEETAAASVSAPAPDTIAPNPDTTALCGGQRELPPAAAPAPRDVAMPQSASALRRRRRVRAAAAQAGHSNLAAPAPAPAAKAVAVAAPPAPTSADVAQVEKCNALSARLEAGGEELLAALAQLRGSIWRLACEPQGCRVVQLALQVASRADAAALTDELHGHVREAVGSPHANYVLQKVVEALPTAVAGFVAKELLGAGAATSRHRYGCRIICRLIEHCAGDARTATLMDEVLAESNELSRHSYGHHVVQSVLEHGHAGHRHRVAAAMRGDLLRGARNRNASYVIEKALTHCSEEDRQAMASELLASPDGVPQLAQCQFGGFVVKALLRLPGEDSTAASACFERLQRAAGELQATKYGKRLLEDVGLGADVAA